ncbi:tyrosine-type recombinase/integrase [Sphingopyxis sp.]|uniref:tyrosine-type recombinase/integrase n=1 Tax=Sphingopyxis sp. TaxID=1908224 RepID=UPI0035B378CC
MAARFARLTKPAISALKVGQRINEHGIVAERMKNGDIRFSVNIMVDRERIHRVVGMEGEGVTREQAVRAVEAFRTKAREGRLDLPKGRKSHRLFRESATEYLKQLEDTLSEGDKGFADLPNKRRHLNTYLVPHFGNQRIDKLTDFGVKGYARKRIEAGAKQATVNRELSTLSHFLRRMKVTTRPEIVKAEEERKKIDALTVRQQQDLMKAARGDQDPATHLFVAFGLGSAMRHSEILKARFDKIDWDQRRLYIPTAKAGQRIQPLTPSLVELLRIEREQREDQDGFIFPATRKDAKKPHRQSMARQFERSVVRAKLDPKKVTPHVMRHTAITQLITAGTDLPTVQKISGHKTLAMVLRYAQIADPHVDRSIEALGAGFADAITQDLHTDENQAAASGV